MAMVTGNVDRVTSKPVGARGNLAYSLNVDGDWYGHGFDKPSVTEGQNISFDYEQKGQYKNVIVRTVVVNAAPAGQAAPSGGGGKPNNTQLAIQYQASRNSALQLVEMALAHDAVPLPTKKADRLDAIAALVDAWTAEFHMATDKVVVDGGVFPNDLESAMATGGDFE